VPTFARLDAKSATASRLIKTARQTILKALPRPTEKAAVRLVSVLAAAYQTIPLQRLVSIQKIIQTTPAYRLAETFRNVYTQLDIIMQDLGHGVKQQVQPDDAISSFLKAVGAKGWKTQDFCERVELETDAYRQAQQYLENIAIVPNDLLHTDYGVVELPIVILQGYLVPRQSINNWSQPPHNLSIAVVFNQYLALTPVPCLGIKSNLVELVEEDRLYVDMKQFFSVARRIGSSPPIPAPRLISGYYYCPIWNEDDESRRFLQHWDLVRKDV
jgi:hypothetical protein